jgi:protein TonB
MTSRFDPEPALMHGLLGGSDQAVRTRRRLPALMAAVGFLQAAALGVICFLPVFAPAPSPSAVGVFGRVLFYDPPPPPPPPLPRGTMLELKARRPEAARPVPVEPAEPERETPIESVATPEPASVETDPGAREEDRFGSPAGIELGSVLGVESGGDEGVVGGLPGGIPGGAIGGTGTGAVLDYDAPPRILRQPIPRYPPDAFVQKLEGTVTFEILIDADGHVARARLVQSIPSLDRAAYQAVLQWLFQPAVKHGRPVATIALAPVRFRIR